MAEEVELCVEIGANNDPLEAWVEKADINQLCRACANTHENMIPIFEGDGLEHDLQAKIDKHFPINISKDDGLPHQMCFQCASTLVAWHDMYTGCIDAEKKLKNLLKKSEDGGQVKEEGFQSSIVTCDDLASGKTKSQRKIGSEMEVDDDYDDDDDDDRGDDEIETEEVVLHKLDAKKKENTVELGGKGTTIRDQYLASGMTFVDLEFDFHISRKTTRLIVKEVCVVIWNVLQPTEMPTPDKAMWLEKAVAFQKITNFPNCIGSVDGKHIRIRCPLQTGSQHYNFKHFFSIVLMAVCDANYYFTAIDVGAYGREGDPTIFNKSNFGQRLKSGQLDIPPPTPLRAADGSEVGQPVPYVLLGDEAFGLSRNLMRPYPSKGLTKQKRVYNYRHCRGRRVVECSFGILSNKWRVLHSAMLVAPDYATVIVQACCVLHNFVRKRDGFIFEDTLTCDLDDMEGVAAVGGQNKGIDIREMFCRFFNNEGAVPWQDARV